MCTYIFWTAYVVLNLVTPAIVTWSINTREGLVKLIACNDVPGCWVDMWRSGAFLLYSYKVGFWTKQRCQDCLMSNAQSYHDPCLQSVAHSLICVFSGNVNSSTHLHNIQVCHCTWSVLPGISTASDNTGVRRPGYEATMMLLHRSYDSLLFSLLEVQFIVLLT